MNKLTYHNQVPVRSRAILWRTHPSATASSHVQQPQTPIISINTAQAKNKFAFTNYICYHI